MREEDLMNKEDYQFLLEFLNNIDPLGEVFQNSKEMIEKVIEEN